MTDVLLIQTGNEGGDLRINANDIEVINGYENLPFLAMFSGDGNWWANTLLLQGNNFVSETETALKTNVLNSAGRVNIERAIINDLAFLADITGTTYSVVVTIAGQNRLSIIITINGNNFYYNWNPSEGFKQYSI